MLEILVHTNIGRIPKTHQYVVADVPENVNVEQYDHASLPSGWDSENILVARGFGDRWLSEARSAVLLVPSVVVRSEWNALVNPAHPDARLLTCSNPENVIWDKRLFQRLRG
jgi:RES domain-containing protein